MPQATLGRLIERLATSDETPRRAIMEWSRARAGEKVPCINSVQGTDYLNLPAVKAALHVDTSPNTWQICGGVDYRDDGVYDSMIGARARCPRHPLVSPLCSMNSHAASGVTPGP